MASKTVERQSASKTIGKVFQGSGPLTEEEEQQFKRLIEEVAEFHKRGRFPEDSGADNR